MDGSDRLHGDSGSGLRHVFKQRPGVLRLGRGITWDLSIEVRWAFSAIPWSTVWSVDESLDGGLLLEKEVGRGGRVQLLIRELLLLLGVWPRRARRVAFCRGYTGHLSQTDLQKIGTF